MTTDRDVRIQMRRAIHRFHDGQPASQEWVQQGMAYAARHGSYASPLRGGVGGGSYIVFYPDRVEWWFIITTLSDDYVVVLRSDDRTWKLFHDRYGTGRDHDLLFEFGEDHQVRKINTAQFETIADTFSGQIDRYGQYYLGWPVPPPYKMPMHPQKKRQMIILACILAVLALCGSCGLYGLLFLVAANHR